MHAPEPVPLHWAHEASHDWHWPVWALPNKPEPQFNTHVRPSRYTPVGQDEHCDALGPMQDAHAELHAEQYVLLDPEQDPARYWLLWHDADAVQATHVGELWPAHTPERYWPREHEDTHELHCRLLDELQGVVSYWLPAAHVAHGVHVGLEDVEQAPSK